MVTGCEDEEEGGEHPESIRTCFLKHDMRDLCFITVLEDDDG